jgi:hypothetical protein
MKYLFLILAVFSLVAQAENQSSHLSASAITPPTMQTWTTEALFNTISNSEQSTFGPSLLYSLNPRNELGLRALAPFSNSDSVGTTSLMAVYRHHLSESKTNLFSEATLGVNYYSFGNISRETSAPSIGTNLGVIHHLTPDIAFGGLAGVEWTQTYLSHGYANNVQNSIYAYARIALFGSLTF